MKILLLNDNPVVNKLVTLSAQKTSDELDVTSSLDNISKNSYDLLIVDDTIYHDDILNDIKKKISYTKSLFICSRDAEEVYTFDSVLKKPFLPTDLVELFSSISREINAIDLSSKQEEDELTPDDEFEDLDDDFGEDIDLDTDITQSVLDNDEAQKVKELLDETSEELEELEELEDLDDELDLSDIDLSFESEKELSLDDEIDFDLEDSLELESDDELDFDLEDSLELESEDDIKDTIEEEVEDEEEFSLDDELDNELNFDLEDSLELESEDEIEEEISLDDVNIEDQIKTAVSELSEEDLEGEVSDETLLEIAETEIDSFDTLNSKDLKLAIGEEVQEVEEEIILEDTSEDDITEVPLEKEKSTKKSVSSTDGVEALKNLLTALTNENVAASMKGMKISINITLGDN
jgi:uncharacterized membrane protein